MKIKVLQAFKINQVKPFQTTQVNLSSQGNTKTVLLQKIIINQNLRNNGKRITIKKVLIKKEFMIFQEEHTEEEVEEEEVITMKALIQETEIKVGVQAKRFKIGMKTEISIKITKDKDTKTRDIKIMIRTKIGDQKITIMTNNLKDMTTKTITKDNKKTSQKRIMNKGTIIWEKLEVKSPIMMTMLIIEN